MAFQGAPKMSLVAQYDDLCRYTKILTAGSEEEFKVFVESQLKCVRNWKEADTEKNKLKEKVTTLEAEKKKLEFNLQHARNYFDVEVAKRITVEEEKKALERQLALIREVLLADATMDNQTKEKLAFLNSHTRQVSPPRNLSDEELQSVLEACEGQGPQLQKKNLTTIEESCGSLISSTDYDQTVEDDECRPSVGRLRNSKGKRSSSENAGSPKKKKSDKIEFATGYDYHEKGYLPFKNTGIRTNSEPAKNDDEIFVNHNVQRSDSDLCNKYDLRRPLTSTISAGTPVGRYSTGGKLSRTHNFSNKTILRTEKCVPCGRIIKFCKHAMKCQDCRVVCHPECQDKCPLPCIPALNTPTKGSLGYLADFVSSIPPMIPSLIVHCVNEIETRGLKEVGLYRIPGAEREVKDLKEKFIKGKSVPCLAQVDIHAICGTVKSFLSSLKEPLIPMSSWQTFVDAAVEINNLSLSLNALYEAVFCLPQPNRDTLAFLILHLQRIAESEFCKMPIESLAKMFGPTVLRYSEQLPPGDKMMSELPYQLQSSKDTKDNITQEHVLAPKASEKVMERLLSINADSWQNILNVETDVFQPAIAKTPETTPAPKATRLGPVYTGGKAQNVTLAKTSLTPRNLKHSKSGRPNFSSPYMK